MSTEGADGGGGGALQGGGVGLEFVHAHPSERSEGREPGVLRSNTQTVESVRLASGHLSPVGKAGDPWDLVVFYHEQGGKNKYLDFEIKLREGQPGAVALTYTLCTTGDGAAVRDQGILKAVGQHGMPLASPLVLKPGEAVHVLLRIEQVSARHQGRPYLVRFAARAAEQVANQGAASAAVASSANSAPQVDPLHHALLQLAIAHGPWLPSAAGDGFRCPACEITHDTAEHDRTHNPGCVLAGALAEEASPTALLLEHTLDSDPILVLSKAPRAGSPKQAAGGHPQQAAVGSSGGGGGVSGSGERQPQHRSPAKSPRRKKAALGTRAASADNINDGESMTDQLAAALGPMAVSPIPFPRAAGAGDGGGAWSTPVLMGLQQTMLSRSSSDDSNEKS